MEALSPLLYSGLGSIIYALIKFDGRMQSEESLNARLILLDQGPLGVQAVHSFQLCEHYRKSVEEAYHSAMNCFVSHKKELNHEVKQYFIGVMRKIVKSDNRVTRKEVEFLKKFREDLHNI
ncbi:MAG TPA: hypothetical protein DCR35_08020 [Runella sp.]|nr:hypothetical protein [Runella sp.]HAO49239.1 hypothetical protein [Runella sp.]